MGTREGGAHLLDNILLVLVRDGSKSGDHGGDAFRGLHGRGRGM